VLVENRAQICAFAQALGQHARTGPIGALVIAGVVAATKPKPRPLPDQAIPSLAELVAGRRWIIAMMLAERQRQKRLVAPRLQHSITRLLEALQKELSEVDREICAEPRGSDRRRRRAAPAWSRTALAASIKRQTPPLTGHIVA